MTAGQVADNIRLLGHPCKNIVFTGGEPLLQQKEIKQIIKELGFSYHYEVETNGTIIPSLFLAIRIDSWVISPKLGYTKEAVLKWFAEKRKVIFKIVVGHIDDTIMLELLDTHKVKPNKIYIMPKGTSDRILKKHSKWIVELCKRSGYNFSPRLQIWLWGKKRGV